MEILLLGNKSLHKLDLPSRIEGSFVFPDPLTKEPLFMIEAHNNVWVIFASSDSILKDTSNTLITKNILKDDDCYFLEANNNKYIVYAQNARDESFKMFKVKGEGNLSFGNGEEDNLFYNFNPLITSNYFNIQFQSGVWKLWTNQNSIIYVNEKRITNQEIIIKNGDILFALGIKIIFASNFLFINKIIDKNNLKTDMLVPISIKEAQVPYEEVKEKDFYKDEDYYFKTPRIRRFVETYELSVANPPGKNQKDEMPWILRVGPRITMALISVFNFINTISNIISGKTTLAQSWIRLFSVVAMMMTSFLWPNILKKYQNKQIEKKEAQRKDKYLAYLEEKKQEIIKEAINQTNIIKENLLPLKECYETIITKRRTLWEKKISQRDFLSVRVGLGDKPIDMKIKFSEDDFVIEKDVLKEVATNMVDEAKMIKNVPIDFSFFRKPVVAIMGKEEVRTAFMNNLLLQILAYHSYDELKIVVFTNEDNRTHWDAYKDLPHMFSNDKSFRFFSKSKEEAKQLNNFLEYEFDNRVNNPKGVLVKENESQDEETKQTETYIPYYLIITDDYLAIRKLGICEKVLEASESYGFTFVVLDNRLSRLPSTCTNFIMLDKPVSSILKNDGDDYTQQTFYDEIDSSFDMSLCTSILSNIPIEFHQDLRYLPTSLGFLEMYNVGKIEQLNILNRWKINNPTETLQAPLGVNDQGDIICLDLHEKYHGPHGLIAGTTGSGKSEFIITYILSMSVNYSPNEVAFILIDYKGGGLAGAFENKKNNVRLPHLAGTITNLDKNELNRTLVSIQSELSRRQTVFNEARDFLGESTIDIYKYQKFFREGRLQEPMPHLFIICDEFAELKAQQPEFMDNLISAARIGRSLGVHLILATQKPSGVVNAQIWSNTRFRVCLKVADKGDSNEVIKCPDAADIKNAGRFYLQVGFNELFILGQSGWCGTPYIPSDTIKKEFDRSINFISENGIIIKSVDEESLGVKKKVNSTGDELGNILKYISEMAYRENLLTDNLWLESIPGTIYLHDIIEKYSFKSEDVVAVIGEYDDPASQYQNILTLPLDENGNTIVYSTSGVSREMFLKTLIYSSASLYSSEDVNFYVLDFGSETFKIFTKIPHVGDVVFATENDKVEKIIDIFVSEIETRKKLFVEYNGEYKNYKKNSGKKMPLYVLIINNYEAFMEIYSNYNDILMKIAREGKRYGVLFVITTSSNSGLFNRFLTNFDNKFVIDMNGKNEYSNFLGKIGDVIPAEYPGRGLFKKEIAYEFQTAKICDDNNFVEFIKTNADKLLETNSYIAKPIPVLPDVVEFKSVEDKLTDLKNVPVGIAKEKLETYFYNFLKDRATIITSNEIENSRSFMISLLEMFKRMNVVTVLFDFNDMFEDLKQHANSYCHKDYLVFLQKILLFARDRIANTKYHLTLFIVGVDKFKEEIPDNKRNEINRMLKKLPNTSLIYVDNAFTLKKFAFESWFTESTVNVNGFWIGSGVTEQSVLKYRGYNKVYTKKISNDFAWIFKNGNIELVKLVKLENDNEE